MTKQNLAGNFLFPVNFQGLSQVGILLPEIVIITVQLPRVIEKVNKVDVNPPFEFF